MKLFKYNTILLLMMFGGLAAAGAYATPSAPTRGPSVGHRPVITGLILGASDAGGIYKGDMTLSSTSLKPGEGIGLFSAAGGPNAMDVDEDLDKAGAHCVWYRVDTQGVETVARDPGPNDRNCSYTIQSGDVGHRIKNVITIFSDQDIATQKGFTLNPIASMPVETVSANSVEVLLKPFNRITVNGGREVSHASFPVTGFKGAKFTLHADDVASNYIWESDNKNVSVIANSGDVIFNNKTISEDVTIKAVSKNNNANHYFTFRVKKWITHSGNVKMDFPATRTYCPKGSERPIFTDIREINMDWSSGKGGISDATFPDSGFSTDPDHDASSYWYNSVSAFGAEAVSLLHGGYRPQSESNMHYALCKTSV